MSCREIACLAAGDGMGGGDTLWGAVLGELLVLALRGLVRLVRRG